MSIAVVTDSTAYLPASLRESHDIGVVPLHVLIGDREYRENVDITAEAVAQALRDGEPCSTSRPSPQAFLDAYDRAESQGADAIVSIHISAEMSSTIGSARLAAGHAGVPVEIVDSRALGMAMGYAAVAAAELAATGADPREVADLARRRCAGTEMVFYVDTLEYLRRGGRIGAASAFLGSRLAIKPILAVRSGHIEALEKVRTAGRALARLRDLVGEAVTAAAGGPGTVSVAVQHLGAADRAADLLTGVVQDHPDLARVDLVEFGAVVGAHVGPGTVAVAVSPSEP